MRYCAYLHHSSSNLANHSLHFSFGLEFHAKCEKWLLGAQSRLVSNLSTVVLDNGSITAESPPQIFRHRLVLLTAGETLRLSAPSCENKGRHVWHPAPVAEISRRDQKSRPAEDLPGAVWSVKKICGLTNFLFPCPSTPP